MTDPTSDTAQKVQHAALGAIDALRHLLDAAEEVVADPRHLQDVVSGVSDWADKVAATFGDAGRSGQPDGESNGGDSNGGESTGDAAQPDEPAAERLRRVPLD